MEIIFEYDHVASSKRLEQLASDKLSKLGDKYESVIRAYVFFKQENTSSPETGKICNIRLSLPGPRLFAEANNDKYEISITESVNDLERQLRKRKGKSSNH